MPLIVRTHEADEQTSTYFARVLSDQPAVKRQLESVDEQRLLVEAVFNGQPVALLLASRQPQGCRVEALVVHPATRGRGVGKELARKGVACLPAPVEWGDSLQKLVSTPRVDV